MQIKRLSASSYSNTAPLIWSFLYGQNRGKYEIILDTAPARSAQLLAQDRVDVALVPIIAYQEISDVRLIPGVCIGAKKSIGSVCLITKGHKLKEVRKVALDVSSRTSVVLTKIIFLEFFGIEPEWHLAEPDPLRMLEKADCALIIGDPALTLSNLVKFDLAELWYSFTGLGFVFAMWMTKKSTCNIDFASARDEGLKHLDEIVSNYIDEIRLDRHDFLNYLKNISYEVDNSMQDGLELYFQLAKKHKLISDNKPLSYVGI